MKHLNIDEILDFVSMTELNSETIKLSAAVNEHIRNCEHCLRVVRAFQIIYDEFSNLNMGRDFREFVSENISEIKKNEKTNSVLSNLDAFDGFR